MSFNLFIIDLNNNLFFNLKKMNKEKTQKDENEKINRNVSIYLLYFFYLIFKKNY